jgi:hypothetical protein
VALDETIDFSAAISGHAKKIVGKSAHVGASPVMLVPEGAPHVVGVLLPHVSLEKHLQRHFARFAPGTQSQLPVVRG